MILIIGYLNRRRQGAALVVLHDRSHLACRILALILHGLLIREPLHQPRRRLLFLISLLAGVHLFLFQLFNISRKRILGRRDQVLQRLFVMFVILQKLLAVSFVEALGEGYLQMIDLSIFSLQLIFNACFNPRGLIVSLVQVVVLPLLIISFKDLLDMLLRHFFSIGEVG